MGQPSGLTGKITLREPAARESKAGMQSLDALLRVANAALRDANYKLWILLDRLDVAFADSAELETNALRALFKGYLTSRASTTFASRFFYAPTFGRESRRAALEKAAISLVMRR